jgi:hypothetical protein
MKFDSEKIDEAVLALAYLNLHGDARAWKSFDWEALNRLHAKGYISNPISKTKSFGFSEEGLKEAERLCRKIFGEDEK